MLSEASFWMLIDEMRGDAADEGCHRLYAALRQRGPEDVLGFEDRLAEVLHRLDLRSIAKQRWRDTADPWWAPSLPFISADSFLYARCAAVAAGQAAVEAILADHRQFRGRWDLGAERLLYVPREAYEALSGQPWPEDHVSPFSYETGSNPAGGWKRDGFPSGNPQ